MVSKDFSQPIINIASALWHKREATEQVRCDHFAAQKFRRLSLTKLTFAFFVILGGSA